MGWAVVGLVAVVFGWGRMVSSETVDSVTVVRLSNATAARGAVYRFYDPDTEIVCYMVGIRAVSCLPCGTDGATLGIAECDDLD